MQLVDTNFSLIPELASLFSNKFKQRFSENEITIEHMFIIGSRLILFAPKNSHKLLIYNLDIGYDGHQGQGSEFCTDFVNSLQKIPHSIYKINLALPIFSFSIAQYNDVIELEAFQRNNSKIFVLRIPLLVPEPYIFYHLYPIPI